LTARRLVWPVQPEAAYERNDFFLKGDRLRDKFFAISSRGQQLQATTVSVEPSSNQPRSIDRRRYSRV